MSNASIIVPRTHVLIKAVFDQPEARILAQDAGDDKLLADYLDGYGLYGELAVISLKLPKEYILQDQQSQVGKAALLATLYSEPDKDLFVDHQLDLGISAEQANACREFLFDRYPKIPEWKNWLEREGIDSGITTNVFAEPWEPLYHHVVDGRLTHEGFRSAVDVHICKVVDNLYRRALEKLEKSLPRVCRPLGLIDDAIFVLAPSDDADAIPLICKTMETSAFGSPRIMRVKIGCNPTWAACENMVVSQPRHLQPA